MTLSCDCGSWGDDCDWWFDAGTNFFPLEAKQRRRCHSCKELMDPGVDVLKFRCWRVPQTDVEERIHGDEVPLADKHLCERCGGIYLSLTELGYCLSLDGDVRDDLSEYHELVKIDNEYKKQRSGT